MAVVGELIVVLGGMGAPLTASLLKAEGELKGFGATSASTGRLAGLALGGIGLVAVAGIGLGIKAAADFQDAFAGVRKTVDEADLTAAGLSFDSLASSFRGMATEIPVAATEFARIGETAGALGIKATDIVGFTKTVALLGVTTDLTSDQAAESLGKIGTILNFTGNDFANFGDILVNLGNKGASTESEIIEITKRFAAAGLAAGLTTPEILAFSSAIASAGVEPEAAGSSLSRLFSNMVLGAANATAAGKSFATLTGKSFSDWSNLVKTDTVGAMLLVLDSLKDLDKFGQAQALKSIGITNVKDVNAIRALAATYETNLLPAIFNANNATGALSEEAQKRFDTFNAKLVILGNNITELGISIGTGLLPPVTDFVQHLTGIVQGVTDWASANPGLASSLLPVAAAVGALGLGIALLGGPITVIVGAFILLIANIDALKRGIQAVLDLTNQVTHPGGQELPPGAPTSFGQVAPPMPTYAGSPGYSSYSFGDPRANAPWGTFNTPGFGAGQPGSPFAGPRTPIQLQHTTNVHLDGAVIAQSVERTLYNDASVYSSGFASDERPRQ